MPKIDQYLTIAIEKKASDLHFSAGETTRMRVDGDLVSFDEGPKNDAAVREILFEILTEAEREKFIAQKNLDKSYSIPNVGFFRVNCFWNRRGAAAVLRTIPQKIPTLADLNLPDVCRTLSESPRGLVLVTGPTGSGKSTTLAAMINHINTNFPYHILTAEDPVEFVHESKKSLINQREIGASCTTFSDALKYALREDPDVILVGEMRDLETISLALTAAETGHLVFGTLHTRGAAPSVDRIIDSFPANQQAMIRTMLSESLVGVISQVLLKRCDKPGRVAAHEILVVNHAIGNLIREGKTFQMPSIIQTGRKEGMILMDQSIIELVNQKIVAPEEGIVYMENPAPLLGKIGKSPVKPAAFSPPTPPKVSIVQPPIPSTKPLVTPPIPVVPVPMPVRQEEVKLDPINESSIQEIEMADFLDRDEEVILDLADEASESETDVVIDWNANTAVEAEGMVSDLTTEETNPNLNLREDDVSFKSLSEVTETPSVVPQVKSVPVSPSPVPPPSPLFKNVPPPPPLKKKAS